MSENKFFQISLKLILKNKSGEILILKSLKSDPMHGYYDFPGGRITEEEYKKSFLLIIKREVTEELGPKVRYKIDMRPVSLGMHNPYPKNHKNHRSVLWVFFEADYLGGDIKLSSEHTGYKWITLKRKDLTKLFAKGALSGIKNYYAWNK